MDLVEKFVAQLAIVQTVWLPFLVAVLIVAILAWRAVDYAYSTRLDMAAVQSSAMLCELLADRLVNARFVSHQAGLA